MAAQEAEALVDDLQDPGRLAGLTVEVTARLGGSQRDEVKQLQDQVGMLELIGRLQAELGSELTELLDALGLQVGQVHPRIVLVTLGREGAGIDG